MIGSLQNQTSCNLLGWSGSYLNSRRKTVQISNSCPGNQTYCTRFASPFDDSCKAREGSPIICGTDRGNPDVISGMVISEGFCVNNYLHYHSLNEEFGEWIENVLNGAEKVTKYSFGLILSVVLIIVQKFL
jgi:hypothetical protein